MDRQESPPAAWSEKLAPAMLSAALALLFVGGALRGLIAAGVSPEPAELILFVSGVLLLPIFAAGAILCAIRPQPDRQASVVETAVMASAIVLMAGLTALVVLVGTGALQFRQFFPRAEVLLDAGVIVSLAAILFAAFGIGRHEPKIGLLSRRDVQSAALLITGLTFLTAFHSINPSASRFNFVLRMLGEAASEYRLAALVFGALIAVVVLLLVRAEQSLESTQWLAPARGAAIVSALLLCLFYFDFGLPSDLAHYFVNIGPALAALDGRVLMVESFSQYGLGPIVANMIGFLVGPHTLGTAGVVVQLHNLAFYAVGLICLYRMTRFKLGALLLGLLAVGLFLTTWSFGGANYNINAFPSAFGFRYLPTLLMVLALSFLPPGRRFSVWTMLVTAYSAFWSLEATLASLGIHWGLIGLSGIRDRKPLALITGIALSILPAIAALLLVATLTFVQAGVAPDYKTLLSVLLIYGPENPNFWFKANDPDFFGWIAPLGAIFIAMTLSWRAALAADLSPAADTLIQRFMPMALLAAFTSFYFVGRSYPFVLAMCVVPVACLVIPGALEMIGVWWKTRSARWMLVIPFAAIAWLAATTFGILWPPTSPYRLAIQECRDFGHCSPPALAARISFRAHQKPPIDKTDNPSTEGDPRGACYGDPEYIARDAVDMIEKWGADQSRITLLLGQVRRDRQPCHISAEAALMHTGKWHTWPRLYTHMDEYYPAIRKRIKAADVTLDPGALVVVRKDEKLLSSIESHILAVIRERWELCPLPDTAANISAFRIAGKDACAQLPPAE